MKVIADNFTLSNSEILNKLKQKEKKYFYDFFERLLEITDVIDINLGQFKKEAKEIVKFIFNIIYEIHKFRIVIDTVNVDTINYALSFCKEPPILNALSFDNYKIDNILPIAKINNLEIIALVMDSSVPLTIEEKISLTLNMVNIFNENGIPDSNIILDPVVAPLGWDNGSVLNKNNLEYLSLVKEAVSNEIRTVMGFSNLTTGATGGRSVKKLDSYYLAMAYMKNLDYALINVFNKNMINTINFIQVLEGNIIFSPAQFDE